MSSIEVDKQTSQKKEGKVKSSIKSPVDRLLSRRCMIRFCKQNTKPSRMSKEFYTAVRKAMMQEIENIVAITCDNARSDKKFSCLPRHCIISDVSPHATDLPPTVTDQSTTDAIQDAPEGTGGEQ